MLYDKQERKGMSMSRQYTKEERAAAVAFAFEAEGYPEQRGALKKTAKRLGVSKKSLELWQRDAEACPPDLVEQSRRSIRELIEDELVSILQEMGSKKEKASFGQLATAFGILYDKRHIERGGSDKRVDVNVTVNDARSKLESLIIEGHAEEITPSLPEPAD